MASHPTQKDPIRPQGIGQAVSLAPGLYLVATPIGNMRDITLRALDILASADIVVCEDTRVSGKLLKAYDIDTRLMAYHDHSAAKARQKIIHHIQEGKAVAMISDAGMPLVSDPGYKLVRDVIELGLLVSAVPGANAALSGLLLSGLPSDQFCFLGFLPPKSGPRQAALQNWKTVQASLVAYETAPRLLAALTDIHQVLGNRDVAVTRELTKLHEEVRRGSVQELIAYYKESGAPKGEIVLVIDGAGEVEVSDDDIEAMLRKALQDMSVKDAAATVAGATGRPKKEIYALALEIVKTLTDSGDTHF